MTTPEPVTYPFTDPVSGRICELVIPPGGNVFAVPGQPKTGVRHPGCDAVADLCMDLDAFYCPACGYNGRISGAWAADTIGGAVGKEDDFVQDRHADLDAGEFGGAMTDADYYDSIAGEMAAERKAKRQAAYEAWKTRVNEVLMMHIGLIDEELCEQTARFLAAEAWLIDGKPELENRHVLLIAKAVGYENRRDDTPQDAESLRAALGSIASRITTSAMDFGDYEPNAWVYGIAVGWDCEEDHDHDDICGGTGAMEELAACFGWDEAAVALLRAHRKAYADATTEASDA